MDVKLGTTRTFDVITSGATGAVVDADSLPTWEVFENGDDSPILAGTTSKRTGKIGNYDASVEVTAGNGFEDGKSYNLVAAATVGGIPVKDVVASFVAVTASLSDLLLQANAAVQAGTGSATSIALIDAFIERQMANPKPDYSIDGESYSWGSLLGILTSLRSQLRSQQVSDEPFELVSYGRW